MGKFHYYADLAQWQLQAAGEAQAGQATKGRGVGLQLQGWSLLQADVDEEGDIAQVAEIARAARSQGGCSAVVGSVLLTAIPDVYDTGWDAQTQM